MLKEAASLRRDSEHLKKPGTDERAANPCRLVESGRKGEWVVRFDRTDRPRHGCPRVIGDAGEGLPVEHRCSTGPHVHDANDPVRIGEGKRAHQDAVDDGEDRGAGADPEPM
jgi:hypothetical protein